MKKIIKIFIDMKLKWKFFFGFLIAAMIPVSFFSMYAYTNTKNILLEESYLNMESNLAQANKNIQIKLDAYEDTSSLIYVNKTIQDYMSIDFFINGHEDLYYFLRRYFTEVMTVNSEIMELSIYTTNLSVPQDFYYIYRADENLVKEEWYQKALGRNGLPYFTTPEYNTKEELVFYLVRHLNYYHYGVLNNVLKMEIKEDYLYQLISEAGTNNEIMIIDADNKIVSCKDKTIVGTSIYDVLDEYEGTFEDDVRERAVFRGKEMLISSLGTKSGWKTISLASLKKINNNAKQSAMNLFPFAFLFVVMATLLSSAMSALLSKRIRKLMKGVEKMKAGVFGVVIEDHGRDEIGLLAEGFSEMSAKVDALIRDIYQKELIKKSAEISLLQEQINPHFLYNALSSITSLAIRSGDKQISMMVQHLANFYRISLNNGRNVMTIREEINLLKSYLEIQEVRFGDMIVVDFQLDEGLLEYKTIKLILQPLVENAIHHAMRENQETLEITIKLYEDDKGIVFEIIDNGIGMDEKLLQELNEEIQSSVRGYGLKNVSIRIQLQYGKDYGVHVYSEIQIGTKVVISLPKEQ